MAGSAPIFQPITAGGPVATLLLIENSREMAQYWPELRAHYLPTLLGTMRLANPVVPIQVLLLPTSRASTSIDKSRTGQMEYNEQLELGFNFDPQNRIMPSTIQRAIHSLASTFEGVPSTRHLIIVAASDAAMGTDIGLMSTVHTGAEWQALSKQLVQQNIQLHMILRAEHKMDTLTNLFYQTLQAQGKAQGTPWFKTDERKYTLLLSAEHKFPLSFAGSTDTRPEAHIPVLTNSSADMLAMSSNALTADQVSYAGLSSTTPTSPLSDSEVVYPNQPARQPHPPLLRSQTFPPPAAQLQAPEAIPPGTAKPDEVEDGSPKPSLVTRIKKIHGMTKRRTYGANANLRPPLTRTDLSQTQSARATGPNSPGTSRGPLPYHRSAAARAQHFSPVEGPAPPGPRRKSRAQAQLDAKAAQMPAFSEDTSTMSSGMSMTDSSLSSPTNPTRLNSMSSLSSSALGSEAMNASLHAPYSMQQDEYYASTDPSAVNTAVPMSVTWPGPEDGSSPPTAYPDISSQYDPSDAYTGQQWMPEDSWQGGLATSETLESLSMVPVGNDSKQGGPLPISGIPLATSASIMASRTRVSLPFGPNVTSTSAPTSPAVGGDQPFIFDPEYEAEVAARYEETIRAAGISPPVLPSQQRAPPYTAMAVTAPTASRPSLYVSTQCSPMHSGPPSLQASPVVPTQGSSAYGPCGAAPLQQGAPPDDPRYYNPPLQRYGTYA
ncbi:hypothetical protein NEOLEDRAFT_317993 [Neolentinus lepideus HHB14362 ss-1]|uniref:Uncharacterized protein n=1 Tax=Neolentinus lepideus HHB14362 ss-1 TaxID=1314782 RepID=A0A165VUG5_9AGAM|nr:hypothetical protein NEOLEDRAFT_317993 [Neolentinus lepideus HHB14362 ss-1]